MTPTTATVDDLLLMLPERARNTARTAVTSAFPDAVLEAIELLHGGLSGSLVCKIIVDEQPYVLRIILDRTPLNDPTRQFACMRAAADAGVAPAVLFADADLGASVSAFVAPPAVAVARDAAALGTLLRRLHRGPAFPAFMSSFQLIEGGLADLQASGVVLPQLVREVVAAFPEVRSTLAPHLTEAPCHNDLNPGNILPDVDRLWLIDWDGACMGDPILDVAGLLHWFGFDAERRAAFLLAYHDGAPTPIDEAKLLVMEQVSWCFYMLVFLLISRGEDGLGNLDDIAPPSLPTFAEALTQIRDGTMRLHEASARRRLSLVMARQSLHDMAQPDFQIALERLKDAPAR